MTSSPDNLALATASDLVARLIEATRKFEINVCDRCLVEAFTRFEPTALVQQVLGPVLRQAGQLWHDGQLSVVQEHLLSAAMRHQLYTALDKLNRSAKGPLIAFTTLSGERHEMGGLMCALVAAGKGFRCVHLGPDLPVEEIGRFCAHVPVLAVAVSIVTRPAVIDAAGQLQALRNQLPDNVEIWIGGVAAEHVPAAELPSHTVVIHRDFTEFLTRLDQMSRDAGVS